MSFSQSIGLEPERKAIQFESMDQPLRNSLWNALHVFYWDNTQRSGDRLIHNRMQPLYWNIWIRFFEWPIDTLPPSEESARDIIRSWFFQKTTPWNKVYDFVQFVTNIRIPDVITDKHAARFRRYCNAHLEIQSAAYRFIDDQICPITNEQELGAIESASNPVSVLEPAAKHIKAALAKLSDRETPDYRNSIKESISAVESVCKILSGQTKATLAPALENLRKKNWRAAPRLGGRLQEDIQIHVGCGRHSARLDG